MKSLFFFAPHWYSFEAPLGLPYICGYLEERGLKVLQRDLNIESQNYFLSSDYIKESLEEIQGKQKVEDLRWYLVDEIDKNKALTKDENVAVEDYVRSMKTLKKGYEVVSKRFHPTIISFDKFEMKYDLNDSQRIREAIVNRDENPYIEFYEKQVINQIDDDVTLIGISIIGQEQIIPGLTLSYLIKQRYPDIHITIGGTAFTILRKSYKSWSHLFDYFDTVVLYEGEETLYKLITAVADNAGFDSIENLIFRDKDKNAIKTQTAKQQEPLELSTPSFDGFPLDDYFSPGRVIPYALSRTKCYWRKCAFCVHDISINNIFNALPLTRNVNDLIKLKEKYNTDTFDFLVENGLTSEYLEAFSEMLISEKVDIKWRAHFRIDANIEFNKLKEAGCVALFCGIESGSDEVLQKMNKGTTVELNKTILKEIAKADIWTRISLIYGFPGESIEDALGTYRFVIDNKDFIHSLGGGKFILSKNSAVWKQPDKFGVEVEAMENADLALNYKYKIKNGIDISKFVFQFRHALKANYPDYPVWNSISGTSLFKFLTRYNTAAEAKQDFTRAAKAMKE